MSDTPLTREQFEKLMEQIDYCIDGYYRGGEGGIGPVFEQILAHDAALRAQLEQSMRTQVTALERERDEWKERASQADLDCMAYKEGGRLFQQQLAGMTQHRDEYAEKYIAMTQERDDLYNQLHVYKTVYGGT